MLALTTIAAVLIVGGVIGPLVIAAVAVALPAVLAGVVRRLLRYALVFSLPIAISVLLVNLFFFPGGQEVLFRLGPITATAEGLAYAVEILVRIAAFSGAITLFYLTTRPSELVLDLEARGVSPRIAFVANASVQTVPAMAERAGAIIAAQRARGLDTEGSLRRRISGVLPIAAPVIMGSINEVEERSVALEARAFTRPGRRSLLWHPPDSTVQRGLRWLLGAGLLALIAARVAGWQP